MTPLRYFAAVAAFHLLSICASAQEPSKSVLPRVLILGDSVYSQYARGVQTELKGKAEVVIARWEYHELPNSTNALVNLDRLLGNLDSKGNPLPAEQRPKWDLIHFNFGLGDLIHRAPNMQEFRVLPIHVGGVRTTPPKQYEANLQLLARRLKATGAKLVWASTTPIRASRSNVFELGSEVAYNKIAKRVMQQRVTINDMHAYAKSVMNMNKPASHGADPFSFDRKPLHPPIVDLILNEFELE